MYHVKSISDFNTYTQGYNPFLQIVDDNNIPLDGFARLVSSYERVSRVCRLLNDGKPIEFAIENS